MAQPYSPRHSYSTPLVPCPNPSPLSLLFLLLPTNPTWSPASTRTTPPYCLNKPLSIALPCPLPRPPGHALQLCSHNYPCCFSTTPIPQSLSLPFPHIIQLAFHPPFKYKYLCFLILPPSPLPFLSLLQKYLSSPIIPHNAFDLVLHAKRQTCHNTKSQISNLKSQIQIPLTMCLLPIPIPVNFHHCNRTVWPLYCKSLGSARLVASIAQPSAHCDHLIADPSFPCKVNQLPLAKGAAP